MAMARSKKVLLELTTLTAGESDERVEVAEICKMEILFRPPSEISLRRSARLQCGRAAVRCSCHRLPACGNSTHTQREGERVSNSAGPPALCAKHSRAPQWKGRLSSSLSASQIRRAYPKRPARLPTPQVGPLRSARASRLTFGRDGGGKEVSSAVQVNGQHQLPTPHDSQARSSTPLCTWGNPCSRRAVHTGRGEEETRASSSDLHFRNSPISPAGASPSPTLGNPVAWDKQLYFY